MQMKKLFTINSREKIGMLILLCSSIVITYFHFIFSEQMDKINDIKLEIYQKNKKLQEFKKQKQQANTISNDVNQISKNTGNMTTKLSRALKIPEILMQMDQAVKKSGFTLLQMEYSKREKQDQYSMIRIHLQLQGTFDDLAQFLSIVKEYNRIYNVQNLQISTSKESISESKEFIQVSITLYTYGLDK